MARCGGYNDVGRFMRTSLLTIIVHLFTASPPTSPLLRLLCGSAERTGCMLCRSVERNRAHFIS